MGFEEAIAQMSEKVQSLKSNVETEEATKNAFVLPFINTVLGYDIFNPNEVIPEFTADIGIKKKEKVDYALVLDGQVQVIIECKKVGSPLSLENASQLYRYFACTHARIGVLTNGQIWNFYMDLDEPNRMDSRPFLILDLLDIDKSILQELKKLTKPSFNISSIASSAEELKYVGALKRVIADEFKNPSDSFVKTLSSKVYDGAFRQNILAKFHPLVEKALKQFLTDQVNDRLTTALGAEDAPKAPKETPNDNSKEDKETGELLEEDNGIVTTKLEIEGFYIVKAIARSEVDASRVTMRDAKSYCAIFLDDNNRRPVARLYFNTKQKYIGIFDENKECTRHPITSLDDIFLFSDAIRNAVRRIVES